MCLGTLISKPGSDALLLQAWQDTPPIVVELVSRLEVFKINCFKEKAKVLEGMDRVLG